MKFPTTASALANPLEALAQEWQSASMAPATPQAPTPSLDAFRKRLNALADLAEAGDRGADGQALRRIALLSEVWDCLQCDPGQAEAAADLASFCLNAMTLLARAQPAHAGDVSEAPLWILRQSDERWSDYLTLVDPTSSTDEIADLPDPCDQGCLLEPNEPSAIDAQTLLRLITGVGEVAEEPKAASVLQRARPGSGSHETSAASRESAVRPASRPETAVAAALLPDPSPEDRIPGSRESCLQIPPLPTSFELDDEMREAFLADATELFDRIENLVVGLRAHGDPRGAIDELARCLHTLKGAAGSVGLSELAALVHELEERLGEASGRVSHALNDALHQVVGYLDGLIRLLRQSPAATEKSVVQVDRTGETMVSSLGAAENGAPIAGFVAEAPLRISTARCDELTDLAGELIVQGGFWLSQAEFIRTFAATARASRNRLLTSIERLHEGGRGRDGRRARTPVDLQADLPGQLCRLAEQADDLSVLAGSAQAAAGLMADRGDTLVRLSRQLWDSLQSLRIVPIRGLFHRLARVLHDAERVEGRPVEFVMVGEETGVDRAIQDRAFEPLLHVVRNAVGHGIEPPAERARACKPTTGRVTLEARREGNNLVIAVEDDGKGLDHDAIADKARRLGWLAPDATPSPEQLHAFIFQPGFSTRSQANAISGRGVGMDVVAREVSKLRGTIDLTSQPGHGSRVTLRLPSQLALDPALIVRVAGQGLAVPASQIECVQPFEPGVPSSGCPSEEKAITTAPSSSACPPFLVRDQAVPVVFACDTLGISRVTSPPWSMLVVVKTGSRNIGLVVDTIERAEDLVIKPLGALLAGHPLVSGTSLSINGELISVLDPPGLERWLSLRNVSEKVPALASQTQEPRRGVRGEGATVLVVDDSISVRRKMVRQLRGLGLDVHEVADGKEALSRLRSSSYGLVVTDLEMPQLDGFALLAEMKRSATLASIPVVVASTLTDAETRRRVLELGARALLSKPVDPRELARTIEPFRPGVGR
jgi:chemotaxis protein histidine kinase CheA/CheY-like chemotaxis protein